MQYSVTFAAAATDVYTANGVEITKETEAEYDKKVMRGCSDQTEVAATKLGIHHRPVRRSIAPTFSAVRRGAL
jgi:hypothetical protein